MPRARKKSAAEKQLEQSKRFEEAANKVGADEVGKDFERAVGRILGPRPKTLTKNPVK